MRTKLYTRLKLAGLTEHPLRERLNDEFHARLPMPLSSPQIISHLVFKHDGLNVSAERENLARLSRTEVCQSVESSAMHMTLDVRSYRLRWELHTEFSSYTFTQPLSNVGVSEPLQSDATALDAVLPEWLAAIPGQLIVATHVELRSTTDLSPESVMARFASSGQQTVAVQIASEAAWVFTDFMFDNGFSRFLMLETAMTPRQTGRAVQRLLEIETYRIMAILGFPVAKEVGQLLGGAEKELADLMDEISQGRGQVRSPEGDRLALSNLIKLASEIEHSVARTTFRFGASRAYHKLVMQRIKDLRESRLPGFPTLNEFMLRRLLPMMATCAAMAQRQDDLSERIARNSQLLRTRVDVEIERQNHMLLAQMNNRARLQLRLQETVEGLSVVAITYYGSQLVNYLVKGAHFLVPTLPPEIATSFSIPIIALLALFGIRRMRKTLAQEEVSST